MVKQWSWLVAPLLATAVLPTEAAASSSDIMDEIGGEWKMGLRPRQTNQNLQAFKGALGGLSASAITNSGNTERPFEVDGDTFPDYSTAAQRACDNQKNKCADESNNGGGNFKVGDCDKQNENCKKAASSATATSFNALVSSNDEFDFFCDV